MNTFVQRHFVGLSERGHPQRKTFYKFESLNDKRASQKRFCIEPSISVIAKRSVGSQSLYSIGTGLGLMPLLPSLIGP